MVNFARTNTTNINKSDERIECNDKFFEGMVPCGSSEDSNWRCRARDDRHRVCNISIWRCCEGWRCCALHAVCSCDADRRQLRERLFRLYEGFG